MFTGGYGRGDAIPSALPPRRKRPSSPRYAVPPPPEISPPPQNLIVLLLVLPQPCGGFFPGGFFPGRWGTKKKDKNSLWVKSFLLSYSCKDRQQQQPTTITTTIMRHYYALSDSYTGPNPAEYTSGFASTSAAIAFDSLSKRTAWLAATRLLKARAITRPEAIKLTPALKAPAYLKGLKVLPLWDTDATGRAGVAHTGGVVTLQESRW